MDRPTPEGHRLCLDARNYRAGNRVRVLRDGSEAFPRMLEAIAAATESVLVEMYIFADDEIGRQFADALIERARAGIPVRVLYDSIGSLGTEDAFFDRMREGGVEVVEWHTVKTWAPWRITLRKRDHRKIIVVDGRLAFIGSLNIWKVRRSDADPEWRETVMEAEGPVVADVVDLFVRTWRKEHKSDPLPEIPPVPVPDPAGVFAAVLGSERWRSRRSIGRAWYNAIRKAETRVWISNAYFVPAGRYVRALKAAARRGVDVRLILPAEIDHRAVYHASHAYFTRLLKAGVRIFEHEKGILHAKTAVVDGEWSTVGSYNLDHLSLFHNLEVTLIGLDRGVAARVEAMAEADMAESREVKLDAWKRRGFGQKLLERFFYLLRVFL